MSAPLPPGSAKIRTVQLLSLLAVAFFGWYLAFRATTVGGAQPVLATMLLVTESVVLVEFVAEVYRRWPASLPNRPVRNTRDDDPHAARSIDASDITIVVPITSEREDFIRITALAAAELNPAAIVLACASPRPEIDRLAARLNGVYIHRPAGLKAQPGTLPQRVELINSTLEYFVAPWVMILTPGDAPAPDTPRRLTATKTTGVITLHRRISDANSYEVGADLRWERRVDQEVDQPIQVERDLNDWRDLACLVRVEALREIGGLAEDTSAPMQISGRALRQYGWTIDPAPNDLVVGPGSVDLGGRLADVYLHTLAAIKASKFRASPSTIQRRLMDLTAYVPVLAGIRRLLQFLVLSLALITGLTPAVLSLTQILFFVIPAYVLRGAARSALRRGLATPSNVYVDEIRSLSAILAIVPTMLGINIRVRQTAGNRSVDRGGAHGLRVLPVQLISLACLDIAVLVAAFGTLFDLPVGAKGLLFLVCTPIAIVHVIALSSVVFGAATRRQLRSQSRLMVRLDLTINGSPGKAIDVTSRGIGLATKLQLDPGAEVHLAFDLDGEGEIGLTGKVTHTTPLVGSDGLHTMGLELIEGQESDMDRLYRFCGGTWSFQRLKELDALAR